MRCTQYREALSARLDGESTGLADGFPDEAVDRHVAGCPECAAWWDDAVRLHRLTRIAPAEPVPDLSSRLVVAVTRIRRQPSFTALLARAGLAAVGLAQLVWSLASLFTGTDSMGSPPHVTHEFAAWNAGIAVGFLAVVVRTRLAAGLLPALGGFVAILVGVCVVDFTQGHVHFERITSHLLIIAGLILLAVLTWAQRGPRRPRLGGRGARPTANRGERSGRLDGDPEPAGARTASRRDVAGAA